MKEFACLFRFQEKVCIIYKNWFWTVNPMCDTTNWVQDLHDISQFKKIKKIKKI